jgi:NadR type nicotinamide-nucleotide adenylyltransferase
MQKTIKRIAITGPESTGKSRLAKELADYYQTVWVSEYAREYLNKLNRPYNYNDILEIAKKQLENENQLLAKANRFLFCDTDFTVTKIWCNFKYNKCHKWIEEQFDTHKYDHYLLCNIDLPWEYDPQRENATERKELFEIYLTTLKTANYPFSIINGEGSLRILNAREFIDNSFVSK